MTEKSPDSLDDRLDADWAEAWKPTPGDKLVGEVVAISEREGGYGRYPIITVRQEDGGEVAIHAFRTVLASRLAEVQPRIGERIGVKYEGERDGAERRYHAYKVVVDRPEQQVDWSTYSEDVPADSAGSGASASVHAPLDVPADTTGFESEAAVGAKDEDGDIPF